MTQYVAFLRAVNVGGTGKLPMAELRAMARELGFSDIKTYIASGNLVFSSEESAQTVKSALEERLAEYAGKPVAVFVRTATEMRRILSDNPFHGKKSKHTFVVFLQRKPPADAVTQAVRLVDEQLHVGKRELYVHYPSGMSQSKLRIPAAKDGTGRNMNTVRKMVEMSSGE